MRYIPKNRTFQARAVLESGYVVRIFSCISLGLLLACALVCHGGEPVTVNEVRGAVFKDPEGLFEVTVTGHAESSVDAPATAYEFTLRNEQNEVVSITRISFIQKETDKEADLFEGGYEARFLADCKCAVQEYGVVRFLEKPARHYRISLNSGDQTAYERHFVRGRRIYILDVRGPASYADRLKATFEETLASFHFLPARE